MRPDTGTRRLDGGNPARKPQVAGPPDLAQRRLGRSLPDSVLPKDVGASTVGREREEDQPCTHSVGSVSVTLRTAVGAHNFAIFPIDLNDFGAGPRPYPKSGEVRISIDQSW